MSSQGRNAGAVLWIVLAVLSMITAVIFGAVAMDAASQVSDETVVGTSGSLSPFKDADCQTGWKKTQPDQPFQKCYFEHMAQTDKNAALWEREIAVRQSKTQVKGYLAIVFGLVGVAFAVFAAVPAGGRRTEPTPTAPPAPSA
ncbi:hypothetical protein OG242_25990 [Streptomyces sp. NBC_00727]|uniref:hypothetical protein n=1 Tax=Streptomyces sp. NBC_00727 TaxID=2903675 RepID=UPI00386953A0